MNIKIIFIFYFITTVLFGQSQTLEFEHYSTENGLSQNFITTMTIDRFGFLWVGTQDGLNKFDGYRFINYYSYNSKNIVLPDSWITSLVRDKMQNIWIGTRGKGITILNSEDYTTTRFPNKNADAYNLNESNISKFLVDSKNDVWIGTWDNGLYKYNENTKVLSKVQLHNKLDLGNEISELYEDTKGNIWIGTKNFGIYKYIVQTKEIENLGAKSNNNNCLSHNWVTSICEDFNGNIWIGTYGGGLNKYAQNTNTFYHYNARNSSSFGIENNFITVVFEDSENNLWLASDGGGIYLFDYSKNYFKNYKYDISSPTSLNDNSIWSIIEDSSGNLWFGGFSGGLNKLSKNRNMFYQFSKRESSRNSLSDNFVKAIFVDKNNNLWVGHNKGISILDRKNNKWKHLNKEKTVFIRRNHIRALLEDIDGTIWIGTWGEGISQYNPITKDYKIFNFDDKNTFSISNDFIRSIYIDSEKQIWVCTFNGLNKYLRDSGHFKRFTHNSLDNNSLCGNITYTISQDSYGYYWVGTANGLSRFDYKNNIFTTFRHNENDLTSISGDRIRSIYQDSKNNLWIGTYGSGLNLFNYADETFTFFSQKDGLPNNVIYQILEDDNSDLWLSTNKGLSKFNFSKKEFKNYSKDDGLKNIEFNSGASFKAKDGKLLFGGVKGITIIDPKMAYVVNQKIPSIAISSFKIFNNYIEPSKTSIILKKDINLVKEIQLEYFNNFLTFEFTSLDLSNPIKNKYAYKLEGFNKKWTYISSENRIATFTNLDPGNYIFRVKASNSDGIWNKEGKSIAIIIKPPFWDTWWFRIIIAILFLSGLYFAISKRISHLKKERIAEKEFSKKLLQLQEKERERIASGLHDSLGQNLLIIKNRALLAIKSKKKDFSKEQLSEISDEASLAIDEVRQIAYNLHPYQLSKLGLTKAIKSIILNIKESTKIKFREHIDNIDSLFRNEEEIHIYRIAQEIINNIVKHSDATEAKIKITKLGNAIVMNFKDNGKGFDQKNVRKPKSEISGFGLKNIKKRLSLLEGEMKINSKVGTEINIKIQFSSTN